MRRVKRLAIVVEAQAIVIEHLLDAALGAGRMDGDKVLASINAFMAAPKRPGASRKRLARMANALHGWCETIYDRTEAGKAIRPERKRRKSVEREMP